MLKELCQHQPNRLTELHLAKQPHDPSQNARLSRGTTLMGFITLGKKSHSEVRNWLKKQAHLCQRTPPL